MDSQNQISKWLFTTVHVMTHMYNNWNKRPSIDKRNITHHQSSRTSRCTPSRTLRCTPSGIRISRFISLYLTSHHATSQVSSCCITRVISLHLTSHLATSYKSSRGDSRVLSLHHTSHLATSRVLSQHITTRLAASHDRLTVSLE